MEYFKLILLSIIGTSVLLFFYGIFISKKEKHAPTFSKTLYFPLGFLVIVLLTPSIVYILTLNVSEFEGGRGFAMLYLLPLIFFGLLITWIILHFAYRKKKRFYTTSTSIFGFITVVLISIYTYVYFKDKEEQIELKRNSLNCKKQFEDVYSGIVIDTVYGNVKVRKLDSTYNEFRYRFSNKKMMRQYFYKGQKIGKHPNYEKFEVLLKNGTVKEFLIPCYK